MQNSKSRGGGGEASPMADSDFNNSLKCVVLKVQSSNHSKLPYEVLFLLRVHRVLCTQLELHRL